jgi:catechol 2,3-dioxygenase-like lactoylglutathione lyase family enzyme
VPELICSDLERSLAFYKGMLGFSVTFQRAEERFAYLEREHAELMLQQPAGRVFVAGALQPPYGRGINLQIEVSDVEALLAGVTTPGTPLFLPLEEKWYRRDDRLVGNRQFIVQDPDGYLLRFFQDLGFRPV